MGDLRIGRLRVLRLGAGQASASAAALASLVMSMGDDPFREISLAMALDACGPPRFPRLCAEAEATQHKRRHAPAPPSVEREGIHQDRPDAALDSFAQQAPRAM